MTVREAAAHLGLAPATVRHQCLVGAIRAKRHGPDWWITWRAVADYRRDHLGKVGRKAEAK